MTPQVDDLIAAGMSLHQQGRLADAAQGTDRGRITLTPRLPREQYLRQYHQIVSPLCDAGLFTAGVESAYREMWRRWCHAGGVA